MESDANLKNLTGIFKNFLIFLPFLFNNPLFSDLPNNKYFGNQIMQGLVQQDSTYNKSNPELKILVVWKYSLLEVLKLSHCLKSNFSQCCGEPAPVRRSLYMKYRVHFRIFGGVCLVLFTYKVIFQAMRILPPLPHNILPTHSPTRSPGKTVLRDFAREEPACAEVCDTSLAA